VSQENVEIVQRMLEAWQRDDFDAWVAGADRNVEWHTVLERAVEGPESLYRGHEGLRRLWHDYRTELRDFRIEADEIRDAGGDCVVLLARIWFRGVASGIESESPIGMVVTVRRGKMVESIDYLTHQEALKAAGLEE